MTNDVEQRRRADASRDTVAVKRRALELGFDAVGIATLEPNTHADELDAWLAAGHAGTMAYLHRQAAQRKHPARLMPEPNGVFGAMLIIAVVALTAEGLIGWLERRLLAWRPPSTTEVGAL